MAQTATIYTMAIDLADMDRGVYETLDLRVARHPSETAEYMLVRVLAYCLDNQEGIELTEGVSSGDEPALLVRDLTGRVTAWIEVGMPDAGRLHRGSKHARPGRGLHASRRAAAARPAGRGEDPPRRRHSDSRLRPRGDRRSDRAHRSTLVVCPVDLGQRAASLARRPHDRDSDDRAPHRADLKVLGHLKVGLYKGPTT